MPVISSLYEDTCTIYQSAAIEKDGRTSRIWAAVCEDIPCRLSFSSVAANTAGDADSVSQTAKLFLSPLIDVPEGCRISVKRSTGDVLQFACSGLPAVYQTHREVVLAPLEVHA